MLKNLVKYFSEKHLLANIIMILFVVGGVFAWNNTKKEEFPDITFDRIRVSARYPGASAEDVEYFVTKPLEEAIRGVDGVYRIISTSSTGSSSISIEIEKGYDVEDVQDEMRNSVLAVRLPDDVTDDPNVRVFSSSQMAVIDAAIYCTDVHLLDFDTRKKLQEYAYSLENQLVSLIEVSSVNRDGYFDRELQINVDPEKLIENKVSFNKVMREVRNNNIRQPAGNLETREEPKVTVLHELDSPEKLRELVVEGGFEGNSMKLKDLANINVVYDEEKQIIKVNGYQAIVLSIVKSSNAGILECIDVIKKTVANFKKNNVDEENIQIKLLDDESINVSNRINLISTNGLIGFVLILVSLFLFLNMRAGIWVAAGIPFTLLFTMFVAPFFGQTINGMTLAAVIIVMGMIVDDAIVVAENITRMEREGHDRKEAAVIGTYYVVKPIIGSIVTTCIAFIPLYFFTGRYGAFVKYIPLIIFLMLGASLLESILILPGHMTLSLPWGKKKKNGKTAHWFDKIEDLYGSVLERLLPYKFIILTLFAGLFIYSLFLFNTKMKFVMFPREETRELVIAGETPLGTDRLETAERTRKIEDIISKYVGKEVIGFRTSIARSRRGGAVQENKFRIMIEIVGKEERDISADKLVSFMKKDIDKLEGFARVMFQKGRWGQSSGSPIEIIVQQNNDNKRNEICEILAENMQEYEYLENVEIDQELAVEEYKVYLKQPVLKRLSISPSDVSSTFRSALEGSLLYDYTDNDEDISVRFSTIPDVKNDIEKILEFPVENSRNYLVPLKQLVDVKLVKSPNTISRRDLKRTSFVYADMKKNIKITPLEIAEYFEGEIFPKILKKHPTTTLSFGGEVQDTRESQDDFTKAVILVIFLIYIVLTLLFDSLMKPFIIMLSIPFGMTGIIFAFLLHGKLLFGFYAAIGALGLAGVVVNDSIVMLSKLDRELDVFGMKATLGKIARIAQTRLRAVLLTTMTTVAGVLPTAYGFAGYDDMLADMMLALAWGLVFGTFITLVLIPCLYSILLDIKSFSKKVFTN